MSKRRVVVTGLGMVSPVGNDVATSWANITAGNSGIGDITHFDASTFPTRISGEVRDFDPAQYIAPKDIKKMDPFIHYGVAAGIQALKDSGFEVSEANSDRIGAAVGAGIGGLHTIERTSIDFHERGVRKISPFFVPSSIINMVSGQLSIMLGLKGPNIACVTACTTATHNIGLAMRMIQYGEADAMLAGGAEFATTGTAVGGFCSARAMSTRNDDPHGASRPWDAGRDGFVLADGSGVLMLEEYEAAKARGANIYCELVGFGMSGDAYHMTAPSEGGEGAARCMKHAIDDAGLNPEQVEYINAHGTSTPQGDLAEVMAAKSVFGDHAYKLMMSSTKSMTGHLLGAAGGVEAIFSVLALRDNIIPPTINLDNPGEGCDLDFVPHTAREAKVDVVVSNSFGFGGTNGSLVFKRA
ncbi:beta-ketoacyl-ACP synthase II [Oleiagrimonas soli]|uniref:3-oxoacyl-[acyl-carrier-protein] synthase 2 n=1 Tax=Oleiagrimonas soli TaxID=1543381 RepID=A0A099CW29_9GAMM|nr:beta-ketoacyl-ACP synthase II [Oleiagrimonas soli]KGI77944.1 3-oxoacyl-ACP synthase [Oleiagrimonas soli]MBB6183684.1 3-oxoacyl-[acyl-carrier-protein] synthase II [Oleiagrimonas soli]